MCVPAVHSWRSHSQDLRLLLEPEWTLGYLFRVRRQHHASLANGKWRHWPFVAFCSLYTKLYQQKCLDRFLWFGVGSHFTLFSVMIWNLYKMYSNDRFKVTSTLCPEKRCHCIFVHNFATRRVKQCVIPITTKVIAHKASYSKLRPKIGCHGNVPQHRWTPHLTRFLGLIRAHNPNSISIGLTIFAQLSAECPYTLQWGAPFPHHILSMALLPCDLSVITVHVLVCHWFYDINILQGSVIFKYPFTRNLLLRETVKEFWQLVHI